MSNKSEVICKIIDHDSRLEVEFAGTQKADVGSHERADPAR